jgi:hypothetical protein
VVLKAELGVLRLCQDASEHTSEQIKVVQIGLIKNVVSRSLYDQTYEEELHSRSIYLIGRISTKIPSTRLIVEVSNSTSVC